MSKNMCELYNPIKAKDVVNCCNCHSWIWDIGRCKDEDKLKDKDNVQRV